MESYEEPRYPVYPTRSDAIKGRLNSLGIKHHLPIDAMPLVEELLDKINSSQERLREYGSIIEQNYQEYVSKLEELRDELQFTRSHLDCYYGQCINLADQINATRNYNIGLEQRVQEYERSIQQLHQQCHQVQIENSNLRSELYRMSSANAQLENNLRDAEEIQLRLATSDFATMEWFRRSQMFENVNSYLLSELNQTKAAKEQLENDIREAEEMQARYRSEQARMEEEIEVLRNTVESYSYQVDAYILEKRSMLNSLSLKREETCAQCKNTNQNLSRVLLHQQLDNLSHLRLILSTPQNS